MTRSPFVVLARHFARAIVAPPLLTDLGVDFLRRTLASLFAILLVAGIFLTRAFFQRYVDLYASWDESAYFRAVQADTLLMITLPMLVVGITAVLLAPLLFPDELDYRTLAPLPVSRFQIFVAKIAAVAIVAAASALAVNTISSFWFPTAIGGRWMPHPLGSRVAAHAIASTAASLWIFMAVMALQGSCLVMVPAKWRRSVTVVVHSTVFVALLLSVPYVARIPTMDISSASAIERPLVWMPPVWFLGIERWLLERAEDGYAAVARIAVVTSALTMAMIAISYAVLFRNAEQLSDSGRATRNGPRPPVAPVAPVAPGPPVAPTTLAVLSFALQGMVRSRLHQIVFLLVVGIGMSILVGDLLAIIEGNAFFISRPGASVRAAIAAPLLVALAATLALRAAFLVPLDQAAAWMFRVTESPEMRRGALDAVARAFAIVALMPSLTAALLLQPFVIGWRSLPSALMTTLAILLLVEVVLHDWRRLPFTCTYLPGKRVMAYTLGVLFSVYVVFVYLGATLIRWSMLRAWRTLVVGGLLLAAFWLVRQSRLRTWARQPLEFEDEDPLVIRTLNLLPDERH